MLIPLDPADGETILPLSLLKQRVRVIADDEDTDIERMRAQAIDFIERYSSNSLQRRQFQYVADCFSKRIELPIGPVYSVDAIAYDDAEGEEVELDPADWRLGRGYVTAATGTTWPVSSRDPGSVRITFTAGFQNAETEAPLLISAVEVAVAALFDNREAPDWTAAMNVAHNYRPVL